MQPTGSHRMTDLADGVVYSRSGLTYQAGLLEKAGLVTRARSADDERGVTVTITDAGRARLAKVFPGHIEVVSQMLFEPLSPTTSRRSPVCWRRCATTCAPCRPARPHPVAAAPAHRKLPRTPRPTGKLGGWRSPLPRGCGLSHGAADARNDAFHTALILHAVPKRGEI